MRILIWLIRIVLFALFLILAVANTQDATLNFTAGMAWEAPLILIGFAFFAAGLLAGLLLTLPTSIRRRFEIARLKRELAVAQQARDKDELPPPPPFI
ncbi:conserved exported hypothetical protein [Candidatus Glomeribacter gigasporarum BEG34]|uniref:Lipopolysaccharide assembly protein A domain-containing protein n=1 Tax=Candidatus Glomeribacter gigasporarum BEG34 TaxID=1070319 RepID=G2J9G2_9BURK|nr:lipopolysaccharide assembly protein LapA domain-containing protein [Candidatus Glomeribacter gigasporarum]CCD29409.1 conserved exported hypothetical protein [Candidatus Glomeribacter gigasporarum BEG34]